MVLPNSNGENNNQSNQNNLSSQIPNFLGNWPFGQASSQAESYPLLFGNYGGLFAQNQPGQQHGQPLNLNIPQAVPFPYFYGQMPSIFYSPNMRAGGTPPIYGTQLRGGVPFIPTVHSPASTGDMLTPPINNLTENRSGHPNQKRGIRPPLSEEDALFPQRNQARRLWEDGTAENPIHVPPLHAEKKPAICDLFGGDIRAGEAPSSAVEDEVPMAGAGMAGRAEEDGQQKAQARGNADEQVDVENEGGHQEGLEEGEIVDTPPESEDEANREQAPEDIVPTGLGPMQPLSTSILTGLVLKIIQNNAPQMAAAPPTASVDFCFGNLFRRLLFFLEISLLWRSEHCVDKCPYLGKRV